MNLQHPKSKTWSSSEKAGFETLCYVVNPLDPVFLFLDESTGFKNFQVLRYIVYFLC